MKLNGRRNEGQIGFVGLVELIQSGIKGQAKVFQLIVGSGFLCHWIDDADQLPVLPKRISQQSVDGSVAIAANADQDD